MSAALIEHSRAYLLEIVRTATGARFSLDPVHTAESPTLHGFLCADIDLDEVHRLIGELHLLLNRLNMRGEVDDASSEEVRKIGHLLFDELLPGPIKDFLRAHDGLDLLVRTDEELADIPWELLHTGEAYLALRFNIGRLLAVEGLARTTRPRQLKAPVEALILADPCGDLDAAYDEGIKIRAVLDAQPWLRVTLKTSEVDRAYVRENIREFDILHFAGHGQVDGAGEGWLLSDGRLTAADLHRLVGGRPFPALIFANACASGRAGHRATAHSLARAGIEAGVRHFIGTHWDVPDEIAGQFAEHFYRGLCHGMSVGAALRQARLAMSLVYGHGTMLWGSYCLYGDPHHVYFPDAANLPAREANDLPILDVAPVARGIYHTIEIPVSELKAPPASAHLGPHPSLRSDLAVEHAALTLEEGFELRRLWIGLGALTALAVVALLAWDIGAGGDAAPDLKRVASAPAAPAPAAPAPDELGLAAVLREQEEAERKAPPRVEFDVVAQTRTADDALAEVRVIEGTRLRSGDNLRVRIKADRDVYIALVLIDDHAPPQVLFPHPSVKRPGGNYVTGGEAVSLPGDGLWYRLDKKVGSETLLVLADKQPLTDLDDLVAAIDKLPLQPRAARAQDGIVIRGFNGVTADSAAPARARTTPTSAEGRTRLLAQINTLARQHEIDVVQAVTYVHGR